MISTCVFAGLLTTMTLGGDLFEGSVVTPHVLAESVRYGKAVSNEVGARCDVVLVNRSSKAISLQNPQFLGKTPETLRKSREWSWHNLGQVTPVSLPPGARTVWSFNARSLAA